MSAKNIPIGEDSGVAKYTDHDVDLVFMLREEGHSLRAIGKMMDMPVSTVWSILNGKTRATLFDHYRGKK